MLPATRLQLLFVVAFIIAAGLVAVQLQHTPQTRTSQHGSSVPAPPLPAAESMAGLGAFQFEVYGRVQGVYFRKFTVDKAKALRLVGWVANTLRGTVVGECQGPQEQLQQMKEWLSTEGSPHSHIEDCKFKNERNLQQLEFELFERRPNVP